MSAEWRVPLWEELIPTPRVSGKSAEWIESKELEGKNVVYGKWKSAQAYENKGGIFRGKSGAKHRDRGGRREHGGSASSSTSATQGRRGGLVALSDKVGTFPREAKMGGRGSGQAG